MATGLLTWKFSTAVLIFFENKLSTALQNNQTYVYNGNLHSINRIVQIT